MRMTAESGEMRCAWRSTSMPSIFGILMSVTITSYSAPSILFFAACPDCTVSTRCPSRRNAMSSISQMARSSSQTRMLAMQPSSGRGNGFFCEHASVDLGVCPCDLVRRHSALRVKAPQSQHKRRSLSLLGASPDSTFVRLHDLVDDRQSQPGASFKVRLEGFKNLLRLLRTHAGPGVREAHLPVVPQRFERDGQSASALHFHCPDCVFTKVPEHLLDLVAIGNGPGWADGKPAFKGDSGLLRRHAMFYEGQRIFDKIHEINFVKAILLGALVDEEVVHDAV